jgi:hypothetical protein
MDQFYAAVELKDRPELAGMYLRACRRFLSLCIILAIGRQAVCRRRQQHAVHS